MQRFPKFNNTRLFDEHPVILINGVNGEHSSVENGGGAQVLLTSSVRDVATGAPQALVI
jgi:hypothetical protein